MHMKIAARVAGGLLLFFSLGVYAQNAPDALVKATVNEVLGAIKQTRDRKALHGLAE